MDVVREEVGVYDAKTSLSKLLDRVAAGEELVITRHGRPAALLSPPPTPGRTVAWGWARGRLTVPEGFDAPLEDEHLYYGEEA